MTSEKYEALLTVALDIGRNMLVCGAEIYRVEDSFTRIVTAYGGENVHVNAVPSHIIAGVTFEGREYTGTRRISATSTDMELLDKLNALSRRICAEKPDSEEIRSQLNSFKNLKKYTDAERSLHYALTSGAFTLFFGGGALDAAISALIGGSLVWLIRLITKLGGNKVFVALIGSAFSAFLAKVGVHFGFGTDTDKIIIGVIMVLIPGVELLNGIRDFVSGDIQAGIMHISEAIFLAVTIAVGAAGMLMLAARLGL